MASHSSGPAPGFTPQITPSVSPPVTQQPAVQPAQVGVISNGRTASLGGPPQPADIKLVQASIKPFSEPTANVDSIQRSKVSLQAPKTGLIAKIVAFIKSWQASRAKQAALKEFKKEQAKDFKEFIELTTIKSGQSLSHEAFRKLLNNPHGLAAIVNFCAKTYQAENVTFLLAVEEFRRDPNPNQFSIIKNMYIGAGAEYEINLADKFIKEINNIGKPSINSFDNTEKVISQTTWENIKTNPKEFERSCVEIMIKYQRMRK